MHPTAKTDSTSARFTRRAFLGAMGAGAAVVALDLDAAVAAAQRARAEGTLANNFGRVFNLPPFAEATPQVKAALTEMGRLGGIMDAKDPLHEGPIRLITNPELSPNNRDNPFHTAGTTFLGQFLDHDMTFDTTSPLGVPTPPERSPNSRTPVFDLDSVYGGGPGPNPQFYNADRVTFRLESGGLFEDLPRAADGRAIIADGRNDEHLMIAGMHAAFMSFHNRVVERLRAQGTPSLLLFATARRTVTWHYQWIIVHEFLPLIVGRPLVDHIFRFGRQFYRPAGAPVIPVEFQVAYRFGHSMVRPSYRANLAGDNGQPFFGFIFDPAGQGQADPVDLRGGARARRRFIGWQTFFDFGDGQVRPNKRMDTRISTPLFQLPLQAIPSGDPPISLPQRNLLRHLTWSLPSGQRLAATMGIPQVDTSELAAFGFEQNAPLWYYVLKEGQALGDGIQLAGVGARLVGEVFVGLLQKDPGSYLNGQPSWRPTLPSRTPGTFTMVDLLTFAKVDPASRGQ
ncbi:peroxidase family protein [Nonomuraea lactucae]|uniref:peroxidase family protein n=1 Tax=Nonomuraea lactucae TaxID=2249762 RepID=UPI0019669213|nr:heme peroxidase family protein [Nonomuraea lactucae]